MNQLSDYFKLYVLILAIYLAVYFLLAGAVYQVFYILKRDQMRSRKIQPRYPDKKIMYQEIKWSVVTMMILSFISMIVISSLLNGHTRIYYEIRNHGWLYFAGSIVFCIFINDGYFYWVHRFMHLKAVFPKVHRIHHLSKTPTPWSIFSFSPAEAFILYAIFPAFVFFIPLHPVALAVIVIYNVINNISGHLGYEIMPLKFHRHWLLKYSNTVTHHELHHAKVKCNYGLYFNIWDRLMKTNHPENEKRFMKIQDEINHSGTKDNQTAKPSMLIYKRFRYYLLAQSTVATVYYGSMHFVFHMPIELRVSFIDEMLGYNNLFAYVYLSFFFLILISILKSDVHESKQCATAIVLNSIAASFFFIFMPTKIPDYYYHAGPGMSTGILEFIRSRDMNLNCFPSLHISNALSAVYFFNLKRTQPVKTLFWIWFALIACSVISTKQHFFYDILGGMILGIINIFIVKKLFRQAIPQCR
jgi:lathosterol oxidase